MADLVYGICTRNWDGWRACVDTWYATASNDHPWILAPHMSIPQCFEAVYKSTTEPILALIHDDVEIYEKGWDLRVLAQFEDPQVGVVGFGGALGHGSPNLYKVPYHLPNLARQNFMSNMRSAETHGTRFIGERDVAILDGFALFVRRSVLDKWGGWIHPGVGYWLYAEHLCCEARRQGHKIRLVGIDCEHLGGKTVGKVPLVEDYDTDHKTLYDTCCDVLPYRVCA